MERASDSDVVLQDAQVTYVEILNWLFLFCSKMDVLCPTFDGIKDEELALASDGLIELQRARQPGIDAMMLQQHRNLLPPLVDGKIAVLCEAWQVTAYGQHGEEAEWRAMPEHIDERAVAIIADYVLVVLSQDLITRLLNKAQDRLTGGTPLSADVFTLLLQDRCHDVWRLVVEVWREDIPKDNALATLSKNMEFLAAVNYNPERQSQIRAADILRSPGPRVEYLKRFAAEQTRDKENLLKFADNFKAEMNEKAQADREWNAIALWANDMLVEMSDKFNSEKEKVQSGEQRITELLRAPRRHEVLVQCVVYRGCMERLVKVLQKESNEELKKQLDYQTKGQVGEQSKQTEKGLSQGWKGYWTTRFREATKNHTGPIWELRRRMHSVTELDGLCLFEKASELIHNYSEAKYETQRFWKDEEWEILLVIEKLANAIPEKISPKPWEQMTTWRKPG